LLCHRSVGAISFEGKENPLIKEFKSFILRGNVVELAVAVVIAVAFGAVVASLVEDMITPLLGLVNVPDFSEASVTLGEAELRYGLFINAVIAFLMIAAVVFFFVVKPLNRFMPTPPPTKDCAYCLTSIPEDARVCSACTRDVAPKGRARSKARA
jgi:large conductance mechanosensitive channel